MLLNNRTDENIARLKVQIHRVRSLQEYITTVKLASQRCTNGVFLSSGVPLFEHHFLLISANIAINHILPKKLRFFGLHFCHRQTVWV